MLFFILWEMNLWTRKQNARSKKALLFIKINKKKVFSYTITVIRCAGNVFFHRHWLPFLVNSRSKHWYPIRRGWWQFYKFMQMFFRSGVYLFCNQFSYMLYIFLILVIYCCANGNSSLRSFFSFVCIPDWSEWELGDCGDGDNGCGHIHTTCIP